MTLRSRILLFSALLLLSACSAPVEQARERFFWPPPPAEPKIEYLNFYSTEADLRRGRKDSFEELVFGKEVPERVFVRPFAIASDGQNRIFVSDQAENKVFVFDFAMRKVRTLEDAEGQSFLFGFASGLDVAAGGDVYVYDAGKNGLFIFGVDEKLKRVIDLQDKVNRATGIAVDEERRRIYVADTDAHQVQVLDLSGEQVMTIGHRGSAASEFNFPLEVDFDRDGNLYVLDSMNARVQVFDQNGDFLNQFGERGTALGSFRVPKGLAVTDSGLVFVTDSLANRMVVFDAQGNHLITIGAAQFFGDDGVSPGGFYLPSGIDADQRESLWVVDTLNRMFHRFQVLTPEYLAEHPVD